MAPAAGLAANSPASQPNASSDTRIVSNGLYSSHSPGRVRGGRAAGARPASTPKSLAVRAAAPCGAVSQATQIDTTISPAVSAMDCQRKIVWVKGITPVMASNPGGIDAGFACNCAADDDSPIAQTAPSPRYAAAPAAR